MEQETILSTLLELAQDVGLSVRSMPASVDEEGHRGGSLVQLKGKEFFSSITSQKPSTRLRRWPMHFGAGSSYRTVFCRRKSG